MRTSTKPAAQAEEAWTNAFPQASHWQGSTMMKCPWAGHWISTSSRSAALRLILSSNLPGKAGRYDNVDLGDFADAILFICYCNEQTPMNKWVWRLKVFLASYNDNIGHFSAGLKPNCFKQASWSLGGLWPTQLITYLDAFLEKECNHFLLSTCWFKQIYKICKGVTLQKTPMLASTKVHWDFRSKVEH